MFLDGFWGQIVTPCFVFRFHSPDGVLAWDKEMDAKGVEGEGGSKQG